jgi:hypothetical protein
MNYFTLDLITRCGSSDDAVADAAAAEWEATLARYNRHVDALLPRMPPGLRALEGLLLHDARVLSMSRSGDRFVIVLRKDIPPRDVVTLIYQLEGEPLIDREALPVDEQASVMELMYNELDLLEEGGKTLCTESILFSNGWEVHLRFRDVEVVFAEPIYPVPTPAAVTQTV